MRGTIMMAEGMPKEGTITEQFEKAVTKNRRGIPFFTYSLPLCTSSLWDQICCWSLVDHESILENGGFLVTLDHPKQDQFPRAADAEYYA